MMVKRLPLVRNPLDFVPVKINGKEVELGIWADSTLLWEDAEGEIQKREITMIDQHEDGGCTFYAQ